MADGAYKALPMPPPPQPPPAQWIQGKASPGHAPLIRVMARYAPLIMRDHRKPASAPACRLLFPVLVALLPGLAVRCLLPELFFSSQVVG